MLRKANTDDFEFVYGLYMHPQLNRFLLYEPMEAATFAPIFRDLIERGVKYIYVKDQMAIGMCKLVPHTFRSDHIVYLGGLAIHPSVGGKGEGFQMIEEIKSLAGDQGFLRIELSVAISNDRAIHLYEKAGFEKEGILRNYTHLKRENQFLDEVLMSYLLHS